MYSSCTRCTCETQTQLARVACCFAMGEELEFGFVVLLHAHVDGVVDSEDLLLLRWQYPIYIRQTGNDYNAGAS